MPRAGLTRERVIEAGAELADDEGFNSVTLAQLARAFEVKLPTLYSHLANSEDLRKGIALLALSRLAERAEAAVAGRAGKDALVAFADAHRVFAREHPGLFQAARHRLDTATAAASDGERLARIGRDMLRGYRLPEADQVHAVRLIGSFILGFSLLELSGSFDHSAPEASTSWNRGLDGLDAMIRSWAQP